MESNTPADEVRFWVATAAERDFRQSTWRSIPGRLVDEACVGTVQRPTSGYKALFGEAVNAVPLFAGISNLDCAASRST